MIRALLAVVVLFWSVAAGSAEIRKALVIGNQTYAQQLQNPVNDARAMAGALLDLGFDVDLLEDEDLKSMSTLARRIRSEFAGADIAFLYYAGHAVQVDGVNYLLPIDFDGTRPDYTSRWISLNDLLAALNDADVGVKIIVLDACRNAPIPDGTAFGSGLAEIAASGETLVAFATTAGETAADGLGVNSPYTGALVSALETEGQELHSVFRQVRAKVRRATGGQQLPWVSSSIERELVLRPEAPATLVADADTPLPELQWIQIADSRDPADFQTFLASYPGTPREGEARARLANIEQAGARPVPALFVAEDALVAPGGRTIPVTACDAAASDPIDPERIAAGVDRGVLNTRHAVRACLEAVRSDPDNPRLNFLLARAFDVAQDYALAHRYYRVAAERGYGAAKRNLALLTRTGRGVPADAEAAARLYFEAALMGIPDARKAMAKMFEEGWGVPQSTPEMLRWLEMSAADNYAPSLDYLGTLYRLGEKVPGDLRRSFDYYRKAAALGNTNAMANIGRMYKEGLGVEADPEQAVRWYEAATESGNAFAPYHLSEFYRTGISPAPKDPERAEALLRLSAERGYEWALWRLARYKETGELGPRDPYAALFYYSIAQLTAQAIQHGSGEKLASESAEKIRELGEVLGPAEVARAETEARRWFEQNSIYDFGLVYDY